MKIKKFRCILAVLTGVALVAFGSGCGAQEEDSSVILMANSQEKKETGTADVTKTESERTVTGENEVPAETDQTGQLQKELAEIESKSIEYENADWGSMAQQEMNQVTAQWYQLWDDELNSLWARLREEADEKARAEFLEEQRVWVKTKEGNVKAAGEEALGGSLQPQLENTAAEEMTRERCYLLAGYLADIREENFAVPDEVQESIDKENPSLDDIFKKFEGQWIFDENRGACVGVQRTEECTYGMEGSNWTVWVTGGDIFSDLDVYGYTEIAIIFKIEYSDSEAYYKLFHNMDDAVCLAYGSTLDAMDEVIICE